MGSSGGLTFYMICDILLNIIKQLTRKNDINLLFNEFIEVVEQTFQLDNLSVYHIFKKRTKSNSIKKNEYVAIIHKDVKKKQVQLEEDENLIKCFHSQIVVTVETENNLENIYFFPIVVNNEVVNIIKFKAINFEKEDLNIITHLIDILSNQVILIRSKDYDNLTTLLNRQAFNRVINSIYFKKSDKTLYNLNNGYKFLAIIDIDYFKSINDLYGHMIGDETLVLFSLIMKNSFRYDDLLFRYGGEEFIILLKDIENKSVFKVLERLRVNVESYEFPQVEKVTVSCGVTKIDSSSNPATIIDRADKALYYAKDHGRNKIFRYEELVEKELITKVSDKTSDITFF